MPITANRRKGVLLIIAAAILLLVYFLPTPGGLTAEGKNILGIVLFALILWVFDVLPLGVSAFAIVLLIPLMGIMPVGDTFKGFISPVIFFVIATYTISVSILNSPLALRMVRFFFKWAGSSTSKLILAFMCGSAMLSAIVSNVPVCALMMGLALSILKTVEAIPGQSRLGRCFMIAIPFAAMLGGIATPAGSSVNILALFLFNEYTGGNITFVDWMAIGVPICVAIIPIAWWFLIKLFKPETISPEAIDLMTAQIDIPAKITLKEKKILIIIGTMSFLWILSSWIPALNITLIAIGGFLAFFLPGMNIFTWEQFNEGVGWDGILLIGSVTALGVAVVSTGLGSWLVNTTLAGFNGVSLVLLVFAIAMLINLIHFILPVAPAIVSMSVVPLVDLALANGLKPEIAVITIAAMAGCCLLVPLDAVPVMTYTKNYYTVGDMFKAGALISVIICALFAFWGVGIGNLLF